MLRKVSDLEAVCGTEWRVRQVSFNTMAYFDSRGRQMNIEVDAWSGKQVLLGGTWKWLPHNEESIPAERREVIDRVGQALHCLDCPNVDVKPAMQDAGLLPSDRADIGTATVVAPSTLRLQLGERSVTVNWTLDTNRVVVNLPELSRFDPPYEGQAIGPNDMVRLIAVLNQWAFQQGCSAFLKK